VNCLEHGPEARPLACGTPAVLHRDPPGV